ncbi:MAG TPA: hypothetical protein VJH34_00365 [archaeon]|nr:hypothetical protein [archaeon]
MVVIEKASGRGRLVGRAKLKIDDIGKLLNFCRQFDIGNENTGEYVFDVRSGVVHWLDKETKSICSSMYCDILKGDVKIERGDLNWTDDEAVKKWEEIIVKALEKIA